MLYASCLFHFQICTVYVSALKYNSASKIKDLWPVEYERHMSSFFSFSRKLHNQIFAEREEIRIIHKICTGMSFKVQGEQNSKEKDDIKLSGKTQIKSRFISIF
jgi:hypothetical protein